VGAACLREIMQLEAAAAGKRVGGEAAVVADDGVVREARIAIRGDGSLELRGEQCHRGAHVAKGCQQKSRGRGR
jgi:hypothetical protein